MLGPPRRLKGNADPSPFEEAPTPFEVGVAEDDILAAPSRFINRELSWLEFNRRVLEEAANRSHPLLEQLRFLSISANNLDEFFMVRVAGLVGQVLSGETDAVRGRPVAGRATDPPRRAGRPAGGFAAGALAPSARRSGRAPASCIVDAADVVGDERRWLEDYFLLHVFPVLTPLAVDPGASLSVHSQSRLHRRRAGRACRARGAA